ncbi:MAG TPA: hypothetical protein VJS67_10585 [Pseudonocardiaceae bacterium]|nr:hypothetical protein [Pseudonocardiaceae bacterium]
MLDNVRDEQVAAFGTVPAGAVEQPACPAEPPERLSRLAEVEQPKTGPDGAPGSADQVRFLKVDLVSPLQRADGFVIPADEEARHRQQLKVGRS